MNKYLTNPKGDCCFKHCIHICWVKMKILTICTATLEVHRFINSTLSRSSAQGDFLWAKGEIVSSADERTVRGQPLCFRKPNDASLINHLAERERRGTLFTSSKEGSGKEETPDLYRQCQKGRTKCQRHLPPGMTPGREEIYYK
ncbi:hypothetical protein NPIL_615121 [Nephila pilipes]|uniref:Uncharacterized protein n=1 Tax=Nephila pilipes TaxID=299642 RepID=A0A8X6UDS2_NEPPI|nr:hypothetical protein NPIL_615121 [Nephila pilipes]